MREILRAFKEIRTYWFLDFPKRMFNIIHLILQATPEAIRVGTIPIDGIAIRRRKNNDFHFIPQ